MKENIIKSRATSPFGIRNKIGRIIWRIVEKSIFRLSPRTFFKWRAFLLRIFGAKIGEGTHIYPGVNIWAPWNIEIGNDTGIADGVTLYSQSKIKIGSRCIISQESYLCTGTHDYNLPTYPLITFPIEINNDCWVAAGSFLHPGVSLPDGVIIGAKSVVIGPLPEWSVCSGNPCRLLKKRKPY